MRVACALLAPSGVNESRQVSQDPSTYRSYTWYNRTLSALWLRPPPGRRGISDASPSDRDDHGTKNFQPTPNFSRHPRLDTLGPHARARARHTLPTSADTKQLPPRPTPAPPVPTPCAAISRPQITRALVLRPHRVVRPEPASDPRLHCTAAPLALQRRGDGHRQRTRPKTSRPSALHAVHDARCAGGDAPR
jgi:hypothetical protein